MKSKKIIGFPDSSKMDETLGQYGMFVAKNGKNEIVFHDDTLVYFVEGSSVPVSKYCDSSDITQDMLRYWIHEDASMVTDLKLPNKISYVAPDAFDNMPNLTSLSFPFTSQKLSSLEANTFSNCQSLKVLRLSHGIKSIGDHSFEHATSLEMLRMPETLLSVGQNVLKDAPNPVRDFDFTNQFSYYTGNYEDDYIEGATDGDSMIDDNGNVLELYKDIIRDYHVVKISKTKSYHSWSVLLNPQVKPPEAQLFSAASFSGSDGIADGADIKWYVGNEVLVLESKYEGRGRATETIFRPTISHTKKWEDAQWDPYTHQLIKEGKWVCGNEKGTALAQMTVSAKGPSYKYSKFQIFEYPCQHQHPGPQPSMGLTESVQTYQERVRKWRDEVDFYVDHTRWRIDQINDIRARVNLWNNAEDQKKTAGANKCESKAKEKAEQKANYFRDLPVYFNLPCHECGSSDPTIWTYPGGDD